MYDMRALLVWGVQESVPGAVHFSVFRSSEGPSGPNLSGCESVPGAGPTLNGYELLTDSVNIFSRSYDLAFFEVVNTVCYADLCICLGRIAIAPLPSNL